MKIQTGILTFNPETNKKLSDHYCTFYRVGNVMYLQMRLNINDSRTNASDYIEIKLPNGLRWNKKEQQNIRASKNQSSAVKACAHDDDSIVIYSGFKEGDQFEIEGQIPILEWGMAGELEGIPVPVPEKKDNQKKSKYIKVINHKLQTEYINKEKILSIKASNREGCTDITLDSLHEITVYAYPEGFLKELEK